MDRKPIISASDREVFERGAIVAALASLKADGGDVRGALRRGVSAGVAAVLRTKDLRQ